jgi:hypothetical protein
MELVLLNSLLNINMIRGKGTFRSIPVFVAGHVHLVETVTLNRWTRMTLQHEGEGEGEGVLFAVVSAAAIPR